MAVSFLVSSSKGERLSLRESGAFYGGRCPDCRSELVDGPDGGLSKNFHCSSLSCGSTFNDTAFFGVERISDASPRRLMIIADVMEK